MHSPDQRPSFLRLLLSTTPAVALLLAVISSSSFVLVYSQLSKVGESWYPGYNRELRLEPKAPDCDVAELRARLAAAQAAPSKAAVAEDDVDALFDEDEGEAPKPAAPAVEQDDVDALFDEDEGEAPKPAAPAAEQDDVDALFDDDEDEAAPAGVAKVNPEAASYGAAITRCEGRLAEYKSITERRTAGVMQFRSVESVVEVLRDWGVAHQRHLLLLLLLICGATASFARGHISLRPARRALDHYVAEGAQLVVVGLLLWSVWSHKLIDEASRLAIEHPELYIIWLVGLGLMAVANIKNIVKLPEGTQGGGGISALLSVPLYSTMGIIAGTYFLVVENHPAGLSIYLTKLTEFARLYLQVGLYVWIGMLLKRTRLAELAFDLLRPFGLPPELLAFVAVVGAALPTAYSGASGIFVIAVGAVIYEELRKVGARRQLALAATAMSGSLGVVLNPCLLVVIVASLNRQVTTDQLYGWGFKVFLLTSVLFFLASLANRQGPMKMNPLREALPGVGRAFKPLLPYIVLGAVVLGIYDVALEATVDENTAPIILPAVLLLLLMYDRWAVKKAAVAAGETTKSKGFIRALEMATSETTGHIGALLMLMGLSICLGGIVERAELMDMVPQTFGSVYTTMGLLVIILVVIGMTMDPYGAVILVSATIAEVAYRNGIDPVHFWMVVLVAFELGYLTPPVALNHLLTRQVVGEEEVLLALQEGDTFWSRHERILLPVTVMGIALVIVAFVPLFM